MAPLVINHRLTEDQFIDVMHEFSTWRLSGNGGVYVLVAHDPNADVPGMAKPHAVVEIPRRSNTIGAKKNISILVRVEGAGKATVELRFVEGVPRPYIVGTNVAGRRWSLKHFGSNERAWAPEDDPSSVPLSDITS